MSKTTANDLAIKTLKALKNKEAIEPFLDALAVVSPQALANELHSDDLRKAFWINCYNVAVQNALKAHPEKYANKMAFYNKKTIVIAGKWLSPNDMEHGILRRSKWLYGLGFVPTLFPNAFEKQMRVAHLDLRIHFALNCGARSCPPIVVYNPNEVQQQLDDVTAAFLQDNTLVENGKLLLSKLFLWYRGDFGSNTDILDLLESYNAIPKEPFHSIGYDTYDWSLDLENFR
jgi:hypothetical protein